MRKLLFLLVFIPLVSFGQDYGNSAVKKIQYKEENGPYMSSIKYTKYKDGKEIGEGSLVEWKFDKIKMPVSAYSETYHQITIPVGHSIFPNGIKEGDPFISYNYSFINGKLNGLQNIWRGSPKGGKNVSEIAVINNIIIGKQIIASDERYKRPTGNRFLDWEDDYKMKAQREGGYYDYGYLKTGHSWYPSSFPENGYYNLEYLINIFLDDFNALDNAAAMVAAIDDFSADVSLAEAGLLDAEQVKNVKIPIPSYDWDDQGRVVYQFAKPNLWEFGNLKIDAKFESLEGNAAAISYGINRNDEVVIRIDPEKWANASTPTKWYILYHELGHDILNLEHGQGGRMMFNFPTKEYTWKEFFKDRDFMFDYILEKKYKYYNVWMIRWGQ